MTQMTLSIKGGEVAKVDDNIISTPDRDEKPADRDHDNGTNSALGNENEEEFQDAQDDSPPQLRRSTRVRKQPGEFWKSTNLLAHALSARTIPIS